MSDRVIALGGSAIATAPLSSSRTTRHFGFWSDERQERSVDQGVPWEDRGQREHPSNQGSLALASVRS